MGLTTRHHKSGSESKAPKFRFTHHIALAGHGVSDTGERFIKLQIKISGDKIVEAIVRIDTLRRDANRWLPLLNKLGAHLVALGAERELILRIQDDGPREPSFRVATKLGWTAGAFVRPDMVVGESHESLEIYLGGIKEEFGGKYRVSDSPLVDWKEIPKLARGNSRLMLALALAFVGPLGDILGVEQVAVQLFGAPGSGKTGVAIAAGSVWGLHRQRERALSHGFGETWNHTINNLEQVAVAHNHCFLILDETRAAAKSVKGSLIETITDTVMRLDRSTQRGRLTDVDDPGTWWVPFLSTSNPSLDEMAVSGRTTIDDAHRGRLIDVPLPEGGDGIFENLHGYGGKAALTKHLIDLSVQHHGVAAIAYLKKLANWRKRDETELRNWLEQRRRYYLRQTEKLETRGRDLTRIHEKFATIYATGYLAIKFKIFPWTWRELRDALLACERAHIAHAAKFLTTAVTPISALVQLQEHIRQHRDQFIDLRDGLAAPVHNHHTCLGYINDHGGRTEFLFADELFVKISGGKDCAQSLKNALRERDLIVTTKAGEQGEKFTCKRKLVLGQGRQSVVAIDARILTKNPD